MSAQHGRCADCADQLDTRYHLDHRTPLERGGTNTPDNIALVCPRCNARKGTRSLFQWVGILASRGIDHADRRRFGLLLQLPLL